MEVFVLYAACVLIWGSTWYAITFQLGKISPEVSVFYRFFLAALITFFAAVITKKQIRFKLQDHKWFALQGLFMFCLNYICTYISEGFISSGLVAITFMLVVYFNIIGMRVFYGQKIQSRMVLGATVGGVGVICLFYTDVASFLTNPQSSAHSLWGIAVGVVGTLFASFGSLISIRNRKLKYPVMSCNAWSMLYGSLLTAIFCFLLGRHFTFELTLPYVSSLFYLSFFGSFVAFGAYIVLIGKVGADRAAYIAVLTPIIALVVSTFFEGFIWHGVTFFGVGLSILGNVMILNRQV